jgi:uncharacterized peroxidase-related enzyme
MDNRHNDGAPRLQLAEAGPTSDVPTLYRLLASSHASLEGYLGLQNALTNGGLGYRLRNLIAIFVAEANACVYTLSAHVAIARRVGISDDAIADARHGRAADARTDAALRFVNALVHAHGNVNNEELARLRSAGFDDAATVEIISNVGQHLLAIYAALCAALPPDDEPVVPHVYSSQRDWS